jgi:hypothetical protein
MQELNDIIPLGMIPLGWLCPLGIAETISLLQRRVGEKSK